MKKLTAIETLKRCTSQTGDILTFEQMKPLIILAMKQYSAQFQPIQHNYSNNCNCEEGMKDKDNFCTECKREVD